MSSLRVTHELHINYTEQHDITHEWLLSQGQNHFSDQILQLDWYHYLTHETVKPIFKWLN